MCDERENSLTILYVDQSREKLVRQLGKACGINKGKVELEGVILPQKE